MQSAIHFYLDINLAGCFLKFVLYTYKIYKGISMYRQIDLFTLTPFSKAE